MHRLRGDWQEAEDELLRAGLLATPEQRLEWLEEALTLVYTTFDEIDRFAEVMETVARNGLPA